MIVTYINTRHDHLKGGKALPRNLVKLYNVEKYTPKSRNNNSNFILEPSHLRSKNSYANFISPSEKFSVDAHVTKMKVMFG